MSERPRRGMNGERDIWERAACGAVAVIDCREEIPCNPCEDACRRGAIVVGENICDLPRYDPDLCNGCGRCVALCPGMAIVLVDRSSTREGVSVTLPYEMGEEIEEGDEAWALDANGTPLGKGKVVGVAKMGRRNPTRLVTLEVPEGWALKVRGVRVRVMSVEGPLDAGGWPLRDDFPLCRCEEVSRSRVREYTAMGFHSLGALRRQSRVGLGYCQGRFCREMLAGEFRDATGRKPEEAGTFKVRPPVRPVKISLLGGEDG